MATKPTTPKNPAKPKAAPKAGTSALVNGALEPVEDVVDAVAADMRLRDLVDLVTQSSGLKKKDVKLVVEATLAQIGAALEKGQSLNLAGLGKMRVVRAASESGGAITLKLRLGSPGVKPGAVSDDQDAD